MGSVKKKEFDKGISTEVSCDESDSKGEERIGNMRSGVSRGKRIW